jgi:hypothetical protein
MAVAATLAASTPPASCSLGNTAIPALYRLPSGYRLVRGICGYEKRSIWCNVGPARPQSLATRHPGGTVPTVIAHHHVKDKDHWLASPRREEVFGPLGVTNIRTFADPDDPAQVAVLMDVADMDALMAAMSTEAMSEAMAYDGVLPETLVILVEA